MRRFSEVQNKPEAVSLPVHYGFTGHLTGGPDPEDDYSANKLTSYVYDPATGTPEYKAFLVNIKKVS